MEKLALRTPAHAMNDPMNSTYFKGGAQECKWGCKIFIIGRSHLRESLRKGWWRSTHLNDKPNLGYFLDELEFEPGTTRSKGWSQTGSTIFPVTNVSEAIGFVGVGFWTVWSQESDY